MALAPEASRGCCRSSCTALWVSAWSPVFLSIPQCPLRQVIVLKGRHGDNRWEGITMQRQRSNTVWAVLFIYSVTFLAPLGPIRGHFSPLLYPSFPQVEASAPTGSTMDLALISSLSPAFLRPSPALSFPQKENDPQPPAASLGRRSFRELGSTINPPSSQFLHARVGSGLHFQTTKGPSKCFPQIKEPSSPSGEFFLHPVHNNDNNKRAYSLLKRFVILYSHQYFRAGGARTQSM